jgi:hypothetical protein
MKGAYTVISIYFFIGVVLFCSTELDSSPLLVNYRVDVCAHRETEAVEMAVQRCIRDAGRRCRCTCRRTDKPCGDKKYLWNCGCSRLIHDNW